MDSVMETEANALKIYGGGDDLIVAVPGFGCNASLFDEMIEHYHRQYTIAVFDISLLDMPATFELRNYAQIMLHALESSHLLTQHRRFHLLGASMGGFISQIFASVLKCPDSLSLWCTQGPSANGFPKMHVIHNEDLDKLVHYDEYQIGYGSIKQTVCSKTYENREQFLKLVEWKSKNLLPIDLLKRQNTAVMGYLSKSLPLRQIGCPTHVMLAQTDRLIDPIALTQYGEALSTTKLTLIEEYDHLFFKENPELTHQKQDEFFNQYFS